MPCFDNIDKEIVELKAVKKKLCPQCHKQLGIIKKNPYPQNFFIEKCENCNYECGVYLPIKGKG